MASRRAFLKVGVGASLVLALGAGIYRVGALADAAPQPAFLQGAEARAALQAIVPALLDGALVPGPTYRVDVEDVIARVVAAIGALPVASQKEVRNLFALLALAPARRLLCGIAGPWAEAPPVAVHAFLQDWRVSPFGLLRVAYGALQDLAMSAWYGASASWTAIGYPGPQLELGS